MSTYHSIQRANERTRFSGRAAERFIENGIRRGKAAKDFRQKENAFLANCGRDHCVAKAYNGFCLIINDRDECVTLYRLPEWFGRKRFYDRKEGIRNIKRYAKRRAIFHEQEEQ